MVWKSILGNFYNGSVINQRVSMYSTALQGYAFMVIDGKENKKNSSITLCVYICLYLISLYIHTLVHMHIGRYIKSYNHLCFTDQWLTLLPLTIHYYYSSALKTEHACFLYILSVVSIQPNTLWKSWKLTRCPMNSQTDCSTFQWMSYDIQSYAWN